MVCLGYKAPTSIDPKFFDPEFAFADVESDSVRKINSLKKLLEQKRNRGGYADDGKIYREVSLVEFVKAKEPYKILNEHHKFIIDDDETKEMFALLKPPTDIDTLCEDLKVLGKRDLTSLLKYRSKIMRLFAK